MKNEYQPIGLISYTIHKHRCFMYNEITLSNVKMEILGLKFPLTVRLCLN